jgi:pimeloyl-ACP methyl ester carboxylesterase
MRHLTTGTEAVVAEPAFAALRDQRPTTIAAIESRRAPMEAMFATLTTAGIARADLVLAFDFTVQSENQLTRQMLSMRDQAYAYLDEVEGDTGSTPFTVTKVVDYDCAEAGAVVWRDVTGTFQSPLFLTQSPDLPGAAQLKVDANDVPVQNGFIAAPFTVSIPCSLLPADAPAAHAAVLGHGLFGTGASMTQLVPRLGAAIVPWTAVAAATDWRGLSASDVGFVVNEVVGMGESQLHNFAALPDRLRQGMLNTLVLARMMKRGIFNRDTATFRTPLGRPVFAGPETAMYYYGVSLGGIMGTWFAALTPDVEKFGLDVPAINFSCLLQRSTQFSVYDELLVGIGITDPMDALLGLGLLHELWVSGEPAGYARHITSDPLPGAGEPKKILMTPAWLDKQVSNQCTEIAARTLELSNLAPGSVQRGLQGIPDREGPLESAYVMYDTGAFDLFNPAHAPFIPPLANQIPSSVCDPHGARPSIPASIRQLARFLQPGGQVENFCDGDCDASEPEEISNGAAAPCDPLAP